MEPYCYICICIYIILECQNNGVDNIACFVHGISIYPKMMFVTFILFAVNKFGDIQFKRSFNILFVIKE